MRDDLMPIEIEIDPVLGAAALSAAKQLAIELAGFGQVANGESQMKRGHGGFSHDNSDSRTNVTVMDNDKVTK
jgi:hypothetical protein